MQYLCGSGPLLLGDDRLWPLSLAADEHRSILAVQIYYYRLVNNYQQERAESILVLEVRWDAAFGV